MPEVLANRALIKWPDHRIHPESTVVNRQFKHHRFQMFLRSEHFLASHCDRIGQPHLCGVLLTVYHEPPGKDGKRSRCLPYKALTSLYYPCEEVSEAYAALERFKTEDMTPWLAQVAIA